MLRIKGMRSPPLILGLLAVIGALLFVVGSNLELSRESVDTYAIYVSAIERMDQCNKMRQYADYLVQEADRAGREARANPTPGNVARFEYLVDMAIKAMDAVEVLYDEYLELRKKYFEETGALIENVVPA